MSRVEKALMMQLYQLARRFWDRWDERYQQVAPIIEQRIDSFLRLPKEQYFYEMCFCLCTPQSKAEHALQVQRQLEALNFQFADVDPLPLLRDPRHYIRFHRQKAERLCWLKAHWQVIASGLAAAETVATKRQFLVRTVKGLGWKEASHFLRNIGHLDVAIIDRHIVRMMIEVGILSRMTVPRTKKQYEIIEKIFRDFACAVGLTPAHLDLFLWSLRTGVVIK